MPKCKNCQYLVADGYECPEYFCEVFGYDVPEKFQTKDGEGCKCTQKFLKKRRDEAEEEYRKQYDDIPYFFGFLEDAKILIKLIQDKIDIADEEYLKEYHQQLIDKKCSLNISTEDLYAILNYCISFILEMYQEKRYAGNPIQRWNKDQIDWYKLLDLKKDLKE